jgi:ABC-type antimicrobial peptide transport system permease subunit
LFLVLTEALAIALFGGLLGILGALIAVPALGKALAGMLPSIILSRSMLLVGLALAIFAGFASGVIPGVSAMRLRVVNALRRV